MVVFLAVLFYYERHPNGSLPCLTGLKARHRVSSSPSSFQLSNPKLRFAAITALLENRDQKRRRKSKVPIHSVLPFLLVEADTTAASIQGWTPVF